jgi:guanylate kinase
MIFVQRLFVVVGTPGSGKDRLIRAVNDLGAQHADVVPKHTSRQRRDDDGSEMICYPDCDLEACDIRYENYGDQYGIESSTIWKGLREGTFQVVVVSNVGAINELRRKFGEFMVLIYVHSEVDAKKYRRLEQKKGESIEYVERRVTEYRLAFDAYLKNLLAFDHVLISSDFNEDLYDQLFRLFRAYERGYFYHTQVEPIKSERLWIFLQSQGPPYIIGSSPDD